MKKHPVYCYFKDGRLRSPKALELISLLEKISKDPEYIGGTVNDLESEEEFQRVIDYIRNGEDVTYESVTLMALDINLQRKNQPTE
jgi:hypothetical protein